MMELRNIFLYPIEAMNSVKTNVWSVLLIAVGATLVLHNRSDVGGALVTGGFALLRTEYSSVRHLDPGISSKVERNDRTTTESQPST